MQRTRFAQDLLRLNPRAARLALGYWHVAAYGAITFRKEEVESIADGRRTGVTNRFTC
jgi:hypothetical protein